MVLLSTSTHQARRQGNVNLPETVCYKGELQFLGLAFVAAFTSVAGLM
jgi:hypothetical protein